MKCNKLKKENSSVLNSNYLQLFELDISKNDVFVFIYANAQAFYNREGNKMREKL
jgi:hypothetical protein